MNPAKDRPEEEARDERDGEATPRWPQRPPSQGVRRQGLDPQGAGKGGVSPWTATPTHGTTDPSDPYSTQELPTVDRFAGGRPAVPRTPQPPPPQQPVPRTYQPDPRSRAPQSSNSLGETQVAGPDDLAYGGSSRYDDRTLQYTPIQRPQPGMMGGQAAGKSRGNDGQMQVAENYVDPRVDPRHIMRQERRERRKGRYRWILWAVLGLFAVVLMAGVAFTLAWQGQYAGKIYAGVSILDIGMGGRTPDEAKRLVREKVSAFTEQPLTLSWGGKEWRPTAEQLGVIVDVDATVDEAMRVGRGSDFFGGISQQWLAAQAGYVVPLQVELSEPDLQDYLQISVSPEIDQEIFEGDVRLDGTRVVALPGKEGRQVKIYSTIAAVREQIAKLEPGRVGLVVESIQPVVSAQEVKNIEEALAVRISSPITATAPGKQFTLDTGALVRFTTIERNPDRNAPQHLTLGWNEAELTTLAEGWANDAKRLPQDARFAWRDGAVAVLSESIDGFETDSETVVNSIKEHSATADRRVYDLPGKVLTPTVSSKDLDKIGIREKLGTGTSTFRGSSAERATNIRVAANLLNGSVVPPGGTFSFLGAMGGIDEAHGFVEGYVIAAERTQRGVGGGVCQVSTTAFRAAFWSGLAIEERNQHSYRVSWYEVNNEPVGFDAAVFDPGVDLKWVNNTEGYILIEAVTGPDSVTVNIYGTKLANEVKLEGPQITNRVSPPPDVYEVDPRLPAGTKKQVETARGGLDTTITRRTLLANGEERVELFRSSYKAWPNWYVVASPSQIPGNRAVSTPTPNP
jgi:vancomycin resistance protein YoaR